MKVRELIELLKDVDPEADVIVSGREDEYAYDVGDYGECYCHEGIHDLFDRNAGEEVSVKPNCFALIGD